MAPQRSRGDAAASPAPALVTSPGSNSFVLPPVQNLQKPDEEPIARVTHEDERAVTAATHRARTCCGRDAGSVETPGESSELSERQGQRQRWQRWQRRTSSHVSRKSRLARRQSHAGPAAYDIPNAYLNLDELSVSPVENPDENAVYEHHSLEETRSRDGSQLQDVEAHPRPPPRPSAALAAASEADKTEQQDGRGQPSISRLATQIYTVSYLVLFSILGTLARLGLQALTDYTGAPTTFSSIWPNFAGCVVMGFLAEDRMLFLFEWGRPTYESLIQAARRARDEDNEPGSSGTIVTSGTGIDLVAARAAYMATKKTIPLYIGLATGFCGSFTSFSAFIRDMFLALSNNMPGYTLSRNGGYSFMATVSVMILTVSLSMGGLFLGAHVAIALEPFTPSLPFSFTRKVLDRLAVLLGWGCWLGAIFMSIFPPDRGRQDPEIWRGRAVFSLVFAPLGCLGRFYTSLYLNSRIVPFPLGTFVVNVIGTMVLGMSWDLAHVPLGGVIGCQVLQGVEDGFCGCLTTVSTWAAELSSLRRLHAYLYGVASISVSLAATVAIMGGLGWSGGFAPLKCTH